MNESKAQPEMPGATVVAERAVKILDLLKRDADFPAFKAATLQYSSDWTCFDGTVVVAQWNLAEDKEPLFEEALRAVALKSAVFDYTDDELAAEIPVAGPVDEMMHAMLAQVQIFERMQQRLEIQVIHQTDQEDNGYEAGDYTYAAYSAAWGEPNNRFWLDANTVEKRKAHLAGLYRQIGIQHFGHSHDILFAAA
ncbi:hypothetical protein [Streptomyces sp. NPDC088727]|uniref:hypothetical protein n=1 Tax=Streptomyces sp. NPDC088727 TaxID=3365875 RepID=UPI0038016D5E